MGIMYVALGHIKLIQTMNILNHRIRMNTSMYEHQLYTSVLYQILDTTV